ncbi:MAG TPA: type I secretion protein, partial [Gemmobacter sp.]|nr:type I secretion protein [Gemmobacter sp.]
NDDLTGGLGDDRFVYDRTRHEGADILRDFGAGADRIVLSGGSMADVQITAVNNGADARITLGSGTSLLLLGVDAGSLGAEDFLFG